MEEVVIVTRDINGKRTDHFLRWDDVCSYVDKNNFDDENDEILLVIVEGTCIFSGLWTINQLSWDEITGFFA